MTWNDIYKMCITAFLFVAMCFVFGALIVSCTPAPAYEEPVQYEPKCENRTGTRLPQDYPEGLPCDAYSL